MEKKKNELIFITIIEVLANEEWCSDGEQLIVVAALELDSAGVGIVSYACFGYSLNFAFSSR
jgi:hypothetical protein